MVDKPMFAVSTSVGSGKTRAAIEYLAAPEGCTQNFIYVAPTIRLINQTAANLRKRLEQTQGGAVRNLHLIHSESRDNEDIPTSVETLRTINESAGGVGKVVIVTTKTFLTILSKIENPHQWSVILDEAFSPVSFENFYLGSNAAAGWAYFCEVFTVDPEQNYRIVPANGQRLLLEEIASGNLKRSGQMYKGLQPLAAAVANPALCCELVMTPKTKAIFDAVSNPQDNAKVSASSDNPTLLIANYVTPEFFRGFNEVIFMSALFEKTMLYHLWTRVFGIHFREHPRFPKHLLRDIHRDQGRYVAVGHLLHEDDNSSKHNLERNRFSGATDEKEVGQRVVDEAVKVAAQFFQGESFLLQLNKGYDLGSESSIIPAHAVPIPAHSHGLNDYQDCNNVAALAVTNPIPQEAEWIMSRTGLSKAETNLAYRIHTVYQAVGRSSIRKATPSSDRKTFLTVGRQDALMLHELFEGSTWLGQVGDIPSFADIGRLGRPGSLITTTAESIVKYLEALPSETRHISSRALKASIAPMCRGGTWSKAVALARLKTTEWGMESQSFIRRDFRYFFGEDQAVA